MAGKPPEVVPHNDKSRESLISQPAPGVTDATRSELLASLGTLPRNTEARGLHPVAVEGAPKPPAPAATEASAARTTQRPGADATAQTQPPESAIKTLQSGDATAQQKIEAMSKIYDSMPKDAKGRVHITLHDGDQDKKFVVSKEDMGHGVNLTHLNYEDDKGRMHPVLRAVERKGQIEQEQDKHGHKADFQGEWWAKNAGNSNIGKFSDSTSAVPERERTHRTPEREPGYRRHNMPEGEVQNPPAPPPRPHDLGQHPHPENGPSEQPHPGRHPQPHRRHPEGQTGPGEQKQELPERDQTHKKPHHKSEDTDNREQPSKESVGPHIRGTGTAVYDIAHHTVTLPDGTRLEAHSGLGRNKDNPDSTGFHNVGATPKGYYNLSVREGRFHGVEALRLNPTDSTAMHGRGGILAHTYMLRNPGDSNGCVVFRNYPAFLRAYKAGEIKHIEVV